jgi:hypothetical protein
VVFTVRMYGTRPLCGPCLVRNLSSHELRTSRSAPRHTGLSQIVAQLWPVCRAHHPDTRGLQLLHHECVSVCPDGPCNAYH